MQNRKVRASSALCFLESKGEWDWRWVTNKVCSSKHVWSAISSFSTRAPLGASENHTKTQNARTYSPYPGNQRCSSAKTGYGTSNML